MNERRDTVSLNLAESLSAPFCIWEILPVKTFRIRQQEIWDTYTLIEAEDSASAIKKVSDGEGTQVHSEFNRMNDNFSPEEEEDNYMRSSPQ